jgi:hypothetical protein
MTPLEPEVPPAGEEIHLPGPSIQPFLLAIGVTLMIVGLTFKPVVLYLGAALSIFVIAAWVRDARRELDSLPAEHRH